jgi:predicted nucleic acid-binding protein
LRLVLEPNTAVSGLIWQGVPGALLDAALAGKAQLISSVPLLSELEGVLSRPKFQRTIMQRGVKPADLFDGYVALVECVVPAALEVPVS